MDREQLGEYYLYWMGQRGHPQGEGGGAARRTDLQIYNLLREAGVDVPPSRVDPEQPVTRTGSVTSRGSPRSFGRAAAAPRGPPIAQMYGDAYGLPAGYAPPRTFRRADATPAPSGPPARGFVMPREPVEPEPTECLICDTKYSPTMPKKILHGEPKHHLCQQCYNDLKAVDAPFGGPGAPGTKRCPFCRVEGLGRKKCCRKCGLPK